ncbi:MAG: two-component regulator propeller domain-containing protein [Candidatus Omnitrophota bacterium]
MKCKSPNRRLLYGTALIFFLVCSTTGLLGLAPWKAVSQYSLTLWGKREGLPQQTVYGIAQTPNGYLWIATMEGLVRFDGIRFVTYNKGNTRELKSNIILSLFVDRAGTLWIGTASGGLTVYKNGKFTNYSSKRFDFLNEIKAINADRRNNLWLGTSRGLVCLTNGTFKLYTEKNGFPVKRIRALYQARSGDLWAATSAGIIQIIAPGKFSSISATPPILDAPAITLCEKADAIWIGTEGGLLRMDRSNKPILWNNEDFLRYPITALLCDSDNNLWIGTDGKGLIRERNHRFETLPLDPGATTYNYVFTIMEDQEKSLWLGTLDGGLCQLKDTKVTTYTSGEGLLNDSVNCIYEDSQARIWVGTGRGIDCFKNSQYDPTFKVKDELINQKVYGICVDKSDNMWVATISGLFFSSREKNVMYRALNGLSFKSSNCVLQASDGTLWVGTNSGLVYMNKGKVGRFTKKDGLLSNYIFRLLEDKEKSLWICTHHGLNRIKNGKIATFAFNEANDALATGGIEDRDGSLWFGSLNGLVRIKNDRMYTFTTDHGLIDNYVYGVLEDDFGKLWLSGRNGISSVSKKELNEISEKKREKLGSVMLYKEDDGMRSRWCTPGGACKTRDGKLWFATSMGAVLIDPHRMTANRPPPPVIIEEFLVDGEPIDTFGKQPIQLPSGKKRFEFYYTSPSFVSPQNLRFKVKLDDFDSDWIERNHERSFTYTQLTPGYYTFNVMIASEDPTQGVTKASISFYLKPFFYQTVWFYILISLTALFIILSLHRIRIQHLKTSEKKLTNLVQLRTQELNRKTLELEEANTDLQQSARIIEAKNRNILSSFAYAGRIQHSVLPGDERIKMIMDDYFILFKPKDIVSGDFYWFHRSEDKYFMAVVDCTGHGVPGAILSIIGSMTLNDIIDSRIISDPAQFLYHMHKGVQNVLKQEYTEHISNDGMEAGMCMIDFSKKLIMFAGARRPLYYIKDSQFFEIKGDQKSIGGHQKRSETERRFTNHTIPFDSEIIFYMVTDGFADQNNAENKKYGSLRLKEFLQNHAHLEMARQKEALIEELTQYQGSEEQRDDITVTGFKPIYINLNNF